MACSRFAAKTQGVQNVHQYLCNVFGYSDDALRVMSPFVGAGVKGLGELGVVGTAAAIANAIFHATGQRIKDLPITPDKVLAALQQ
jgi:CO/xanthine dehydrogenase Mo-binding subunit